MVKGVQKETRATSSALSLCLSVSVSLSPSTSVSGRLPAGDLPSRSLPPALSGWSEDTGVQLPTWRSGPALGHGWQWCHEAAHWPSLEGNTAPGRQHPYPEDSSATWLGAQTMSPEGLHTPHARSLGICELLYTHPGVGGWRFSLCLSVSLQFLPPAGAGVGGLAMGEA